MHPEKQARIIRTVCTAVVVLLILECAAAALVYGEDAPKKVASMLRKKTIKVSFIKTKSGNKIEYGRKSGLKKKGFSIFQGACSDGEYGYHVLYNKKKNTCRVIKVNIKSKRVVRKSAAYKMYHGNDIAYDRKRDRLVIVHGDGDTKRLSIMDPKTLKRKKVVRLRFNRKFKGASLKTAKRIKGVTGIAYDDKHDRFICSVKSTFNYVVLDHKFKPVKYIRTKTRGKIQKQGMDIIDGRILRVMNRYKGKRVSGNYIYIYAMNGKLKKKIRISTGSEVESIYILNGRMYAATYVEKRSRKKIRGYSYILRFR